MLLFTPVAYMCCFPAKTTGAYFQCSFSEGTARGHSGVLGGTKWHVEICYTQSLLTGFSGVWFMNRQSSTEGPSFALEFRLSREANVCGELSASLCNAQSRAEHHHETSVTGIRSLPPKCPCALRSRCHHKWWPSETDSELKQQFTIFLETQRFSVH